MANLYYLEDFLRALDSWGLTDILLPFLLVFAIVFAIMQKAKILGGKRNINVIVALICGLMFVIPHATGSYPANSDPVLIINSAIPSIAVLMVAVLMLLLMIGVFGWEAKSPVGSFATLIFVVAFIAVVYVFGAAANWWQGWGWLNRFLGTETVALVIMLLVFGIIIAYITSDPESQTAPNMFKKIGEDIGKFFTNK